MMFLRVCPVCRGERRVVLGWVCEPTETELAGGPPYPASVWRAVVELCSACDGEGLIRREKPPENPCGETCA